MLFFFFSNKYLLKTSSISGLFVVVVGDTVVNKIKKSLFLSSLYNSGSAFDFIMLSVLSINILILTKIY